MSWVWFLRRWGRNRLFSPSVGVGTQHRMGYTCAEAKGIELDGISPCQPACQSPPTRLSLLPFLEQPLGALSTLDSTFVPHCLRRKMSGSRLEVLSRF